MCVCVCASVPFCTYVYTPVNSMWKSTGSDDIRHFHWRCASVCLCVLSVGSKALSLAVCVCVFVRAISVRLHACVSVCVPVYQCIFVRTCTHLITVCGKAPAQTIFH